MRKSGGRLPQRPNIKTDSSQKKIVGVPEGGGGRLRIQNSKHNLPGNLYILIPDEIFMKTFMNI